MNISDGTEAGYLRELSDTQNEPGVDVTVHDLFWNGDVLHTVQSMSEPRLVTCP